MLIKFIDTKESALNLREQHLLKYSVLRPDMTLEEVKALFPEQFGNVKSIHEVKIIRGSNLDKIYKDEIKYDGIDFSVWLIYEMWGRLRATTQFKNIVNISGSAIPSCCKTLNIPLLDIKYAIKLKHLNPEFAKEHSERAVRQMKKNHNNPIFNKNIIEGLKQYYKNPENVKAKSERMKEQNQDQFFIKKRMEVIEMRRKDQDYINARSKQAKNQHLNIPGFTKAASERLKKNRKDPEFIKVMNEGYKKLLQDPEYIKAVSDRAKVQMKKQWQDPDYAKANSKRASETLKKLNTDPEFAKARDKRGSERMKTQWADPVKALKLLKSIQLSPNKIEIDYNEYFKDKIRFTGDRQYWVRFNLKYDSGDKQGKYVHKNPDFKANGQKKVIELYGDYWHQNDDPLELIVNYKDVGYDCLVFWEHDVKEHMPEVIELTNLFISAQTEAEWKVVTDKQLEFLARAEAYFKAKKVKKRAKKEEVAV